MHEKQRNATMMLVALMAWTLVSYGEEVAPKPGDLPTGTRNLIYTPEGTPTQTFAVSLEVELQVPNPLPPGGKMWTRVPDNRIFSSGEKVRFSFAPTQDAFAYLLCKNSDGTKVLLWPSLQAGTDSFIPAGRKITIPTTGNPDAGWVFVDPPGIEQLILVLSRVRLPKLDALVGVVQGRGADLNLTENEFKDAEKTIGEIGTRNLMFVPAEGPQAPPIVYTPNPEEPLKVRLDLTHGIPGPPLPAPPLPPPPPLPPAP